jgi:hypothetical protein
MRFRDLPRRQPRHARHGVEVGQERRRAQRQLDDLLAFELVRGPGGWGRAGAIDRGTRDGVRLVEQAPLRWKEPAVKIVHETALPVREISALAVRRDDEGKLQLLAVGDEDFAVITAECDDDGVPKGTRRDDLFLALVGSSAALVEFGPQGATALGVSSEMVLPPEEPFAVPQSEEARLVALASWALDDSAEEILPTLNDIALGADARVYVISAKAHVIARLEEHLRPGERAKFKSSWTIADDLPGRDEARPEGLAMVGTSTPVVGIDSKLAGNNLFVLSAAGSA